VAPHVPPVVHAAVQQLPVPLTPHAPLEHWLLPVHAVPPPSFDMHTPLRPGFAQNMVLGDAQSLSFAHAVLHAVALAQMKPPGHGPAVPAVQPPALLHVPAGVSDEPEHDAVPHDVELVGNTHAPLELQPVAPHVPAVGLHALAQQLPLPARPHTLLVHWLLPVHAPVTSLAMQVPLPPGFAQKLVLGDTQSPSPPHAVLHAVPLAQMKPPAHGPAVPAVQPPALLHVPAGVSDEPEHDAVPHDVELVG
jgi:hypothetical protein